nr:reverse transcriptase domain-containing protein [Tanacetum cinerariifolium]
MDEFYGRKVTISIQWNHRKTMSKENPGSYVHSSRSAKIPKEWQKELCGLLRRNLDIFVWKPSFMTGVPHHIAEHRLNIHEGCLPIRQKKKGQAPERNKAIYEEVEKLVDAGIMKEVHYHSWLSNPMLIDFIVERLEDDFPDTPMKDKEVLPDPWILFIDGSSCVDGSEAGLIITNPKGIELTYALSKGSRHDQILGEDQKPYQHFKEFSIKQVPRGENRKTDTLSKMASTSFTHLSKQVLVEELKEISIDEKEVLAVVKEERRTWMTPIYEYLTDEILPEEKRKARAIPRKAGRYVVTNGVLYKMSFLGPWLRCVWPLQANYVLREIHEGSRSMHAGPRSVVAKALRSGYYWPTMHAKARKLIRECKSCQVHRPVSRNPQQNLTPITSPWPFYKWGIDIAGPFSEGPERANRSLGEGIKARLDERSKNWQEEISHVLWAHRTMITSSNGETSFSLTYGTKAVIPVEIR